MSPKIQAPAHPVIKTCPQPRPIARPRGKVLRVVHTHATSKGHARSYWVLMVSQFAINIVFATGFTAVVAMSCAATMMWNQIKTVPIRTGQRRAR